MTDSLTACYLCGQPVDSSVSSADHVIPRTIRGKGPPKVRGFDYGGVLPTHPECNNRFGDETHVRKALRLLGALYDSNTTLVLPVPGNRSGRVLALNTEKLIGFGPRDFRFFGIHDARNDSVTSFEKPEYYSDKPRANIKKTIICTTLSVLTKSAAALLVKRRLSHLPEKWNVVCVPYVGNTRKSGSSSLLGKTKPFAKDIRVPTKRFEGSSWTVSYEVGAMTAWFFFLMGDDHHLVTDIRERFPVEECFQFEGDTLMELVGHDWPSIGRVRSNG